MPRYYFYDYTDSKGKHEVHKLECSFIPDDKNRTYIGVASDCHEAIRKARSDFPSRRFDGCYYCSRPCHNG